MKFKLIEAYKTTDKLNPKLFKNEHLKEDVREALLKIADSFMEYINEWEIPITILDIWLVGSNASFNYSDKSDIDLHLIANIGEAGECEELTSIACDLIRSSYNKAHDITVKGLPVEVYIEDANSSSITNGIYSVKNDEWIKEPQKLEIVDIDVTNGELYKNYEKKIKDADSLVKIKKLIDELYLLRKTSLAKEGEAGEGNLVFKEIRNNGMLDELKDKALKAEDKELTLEQVGK